MTTQILNNGLKIIFGSLTVNKFIEKEMNDPNIESFKPIDNVSIIVPSFNEEKHIKKSVSSIRGQSLINEYPEYFEIILVDSGSSDNSVNIAEPYVDNIITTNIRGKLTARNLATNQSKGNIIVSVDSDTYYPPFWLNTLLEPFNNLNNLKYNKHISGVVGSTYDPYIPRIPTQLYNIRETIDRKILNRLQMIGRNSAYWKHDFYNIGMFNETINQMNIKSMIKEEEKGFGLKLSRLGNIIFKMNANCIHMGGEKIGCRFGTSDKKLCEKYGFNIERFGINK